MTNFEWLQQEAEHEVASYDVLPPFNFYDNYATLQLNGCQLVLTTDGKWTIEDTSGA